MYSTDVPVHKDWSHTVTTTTVDSATVAYVAVLQQLAEADVSKLVGKIQRASLAKHGLTLTAANVWDYISSVHLKGGGAWNDCRPSPVVPPRVACNCGGVIVLVWVFSPFVSYCQKRSKLILPRPMCHVCQETNAEEAAVLHRPRQKKSGFRWTRSTHTQDRKCSRVLSCAGRQRCLCDGRLASRINA